MQRCFRIGIKGHGYGHSNKYACIINVHVDKKKLNTKAKYIKKLIEPTSY